MKWYFLNLIVAGDQFISAVFGGWCDETISSYLYRLENHGKPAGRILRPAVDWISENVFRRQSLHCYRAYLAERTRAQFPPELR